MIGKNTLKQIILLLWGLMLSIDTKASRVKDIASIKGVRDNQLIGYGLVVGLKGTGDGKMEFTNKSILRMLDSLGVKLESKEIESKNIAAVLVTANLPPFSRGGGRIDVTAHSIGDATSLEGGTLIQTPLRAANQQVFAVAQGSLLIGGGEGGKGHPTVARVPNGAIIEREAEQEFSDRKMFRFTLFSPDFTTAARLAKSVNSGLGGKYASAKDSGSIDVIVPFKYEGNVVEFLALVEGIEVEPDTQAKVVINEKSGTVVIGDRVRISKVAISHGNLSIQVGGAVDTKNKDQSPPRNERVVLLDGETSVGEVVKGLNALGIAPKDLITILQSIKSAGALQGDLEVL